MIIRKSPDEIEKMRDGGPDRCAARSAACSRRSPRRDHADLDAIAERVHPRRTARRRRSRATGASPASARSAPRSNDEIVHGIPSAARRLAEGDMLSLDFGAIWQGFHVDSAVTVFVGGDRLSAEAERLVRVTESALDAAHRRDHARAAGSPTSATRSRQVARRTRLRRWSASTAATASAGRCTRTRSSRTTASRGRGPELRPGPGRRGRADAERWAATRRGTARRVDRGDGRRVAVGALRAHDRRHRGRPRGPHRPTAPRVRSWRDASHRRPVYCRFAPPGGRSARASAGE